MITTYTSYSYNSSVGSVALMAAECVNFGDAMAACTEYVAAHQRDIATIIRCVKESPSATPSECTKVAEIWWDTARKSVQARLGRAARQPIGTTSLAQRGGLEDQEQRQAQNE